MILLSFLLLMGGCLNQSMLANYNKRKAKMQAKLDKAKGQKIIT